MGKFTADLARLRQEIDSNRESRVKDNEERTSQEYVRATSVNTMIAGFASSRANQAIADAQELQAFAAENTRTVADFLDNFGKDHQAMAREGREERSSFVADVAKKTANLMAEFDANHKDTTEKAAKERSDFIANLGHEVASLLENFNITRNNQASESSQERAEFFSDLASSISRFLSETQTNRDNYARISADERKRFVTSVAEQVSSQLESFSQARSEMAKNTSEDRANFVSNLASNVASLINEAASDRAGANAAFFGAGVIAEKKKESPEVNVSKAASTDDKLFIQETADVLKKVEEINEVILQPEPILPNEQFPQEADTLDKEDSVTLWDSLVVKKGKSGDHEKSKKKHHGMTGEEKQENKQDDS